MASTLKSAAALTGAFLAAASVSGCLSPKVEPITGPVAEKFAEPESVIAPADLAAIPFLKQVPLGRQRVRDPDPAPFEIVIG